MVEQNLTPLRRSRRIGRPDGSSLRARFVARWTDEDTGPHEALIEADSEQNVRDLLAPYVGSNDLTIRRLSA